MSSLLESPKIGGLVATTTAAAGSLSMLEWLKGWVAFGASLVGLLLSLVLLIIHTINLRDKLRDRRNADTSMEIPDEHS